MRRRELAWAIFFVVDVIFVKVQWAEDGSRCKALVASTAHVHSQAT